MKKITFVLLAVLMTVSVFTLSSCFKKETPESLVNGAIEEFIECDAVEFDMPVEISVEMMGIKFKIPVNMHIAGAAQNSDNPILSLDMSMSALGIEESKHIYTEGDWRYIIENGECYKEPRVDDEDDLVPVSDTSIFSDTIPAELFEGTEIVENEDGTKTVELDISPEDLIEIIPTVIVEAIAKVAGDENAEISSPHIKFTVDNGRLAEFDLSFEMNGSIDGVSVPASAKLKMDILAYGDDVVITPPEGYENFPLEKSAEEIVNDVFDRLSTANYYNGNMTVALYPFDVTEPLVIRSAIAVNNAQSATPTTSTQVAIGDFNTYEYDIDVYSDGSEWMYIATDELSYKISRDDENMYSSLLGAFTVTEGFPAELFEGVDNTKDEDGSYTAVLTIPAEMSAEMYSDLIDLAKELSFNSSDKFTVSDTDVVVVVFDDEIISYSIGFDLSDGETELTIRAMSSYTVFDTELELTPPEGYESFPEYAEE